METRITKPSLVHREPTSPSPTPHSQRIIRGRKGSPAGTTCNLFSPFLRPKGKGKTFQAGTSHLGGPFHSCRPNVRNLCRKESRTWFQKELQKTPAGPNIIQGGCYWLLISPPGFNARSLLTCPHTEHIQVRDPRKKQAGNGLGSVVL